ncbi:MAG: DNA cytosine methyltransferase [Pseudomonadota bacterium]
MGDGTELYERGVDEPAPTVDTSAGTQPWRLTVKATGQKGSRSRSRSRSSEEPSLPVAIAHNQTAWCWERSATAVMGTDRVAPPGYRVAPDDGHMFDEAIPVTLAELAKLQDMPDDYPFVGTKTQRARQIGNLVPPTLAAAIVRELTR